MMSIKTGLHEQEWNPAVLQKHLLKAEIFCPLDKIEKARRNIAKRKIIRRMLIKERIQYVRKL